MRVRLVQGCVDALVCEVWDVFGIEVGKVEERENRKMRKMKALIPNIYCTKWTSGQVLEMPFTD